MTSKPNMPQLFVHKPVYLKKKQIKYIYLRIIQLLFNFWMIYLHKKAIRKIWLPCYLIGLWTSNFLDKNDKMIISSFLSLI